MKKRIMITGGSGFVAGSVIQQAGEDVEVHALSRGKPIGARPNLIWHEVDLLDPKAMAELFLKVKPDALIHAAAIADIDYCETHREAAEAVNVTATGSLVDRCRTLGTRMIYVSTDTVFDGERAPYSEENPAQPVNFYGQTKLKAESLVREGLPNSMVVRTSLVVGLPMMGVGNSFLSRMLASLQAGQQLSVTDKEIRTPMDVISLGRALLELTDNEASGILHMAGNDRLNRAEMTRQILKRFGYEEDRLEVRDSTQGPGRAARPRDVSLVNQKAKALLSTPLLDLDQALDLILDARKGPAQ